MFPIIENTKVFNNHSFELITKASLMLMSHILFHRSSPNSYNWDDHKYGRLLYYLKRSNNKKYNIIRFDCGNFDVYDNINVLSHKLDSCLQTLQIDTVEAIFFSIRPYKIYDINR